MSSEESNQTSNNSCTGSKVGAGFGGLLGGVIISGIVAGIVVLSLWATGNLYGGSSKFKFSTKKEKKTVYLAKSEDVNGSPDETKLLKSGDSGSLGEEGDKAKNISKKNYKYYMNSDGEIYTDSSHNNQVGSSEAKSNKLGILQLNKGSDYYAILEENTSKNNND